ncbi:dirigent protein 22-like [Cornus florida]|uniref:dirigent protein 22-like n=1 Tax=Cornus florida TaxID=4283 RepID=UPI00289CD249|nr:dirigent protein 22-like [Cornus florida]
MACFLIHTLFTFYFTFFSTLISNTDAAFSEEVSEAIAIKRIEKTSHLHFYFHDILSGKHPSAVQIVTAPNSTTGFGSTMMADDALTEGPDLTSKHIGRAQGIYAVASQSEFSLLLVMNYVFEEGKYNGSGISILGRNPVLNDVREMPIVGGCGLFRYARGYALAHTIWLDYKTGDATVEYNVYVMHY